VTTKPTLNGNATDNVDVISNSRYNTDVLQSAYWFQEVAAGINPYKIPAAALASGAVGLYPNVATNGGFEFWNKGTSFAIGAYGMGPDGWIYNITGSSTLALARTAALESGAFACNCVYTHASGGSGILYQNIENGTDYRGKTVSVTARLKTSAGTGAFVQLYDGTTTAAGNRTTAGALGSSTASLTVGASAGQLRVAIILDTASATVTVESVMLTLSATAQPYAPLPSDLDADRCKRRYQKKRASFRWTTAATGEKEDTFVLLPMPMGGTPSVVATAGTRSNIAAAATSNIASTGCDYQVTATAAATDTFALDETLAFEWNA
jgi:hypothetical protein